MQGGYYFTTGSSFSISSPLRTSYVKNISCANSRLDGIVTSHQSCQPQQSTTTSIFVPLNVTAQQAEKFKVDMTVEEEEVIEILLSLSDGRTLQVITSSILESQIKTTNFVILHHPTPSSCYIWADVIKMYAKHGIKAIAYSRPGYFKSTKKSNTVSTVSDDIFNIQAIIKHFNITSFTSIGIEGGGPYALNSASLSKCKNVILLDPVCYYKNNSTVTIEDPPSVFTTYNTPMTNDDFFKSMNTSLKGEFEAAISGRSALTNYITANVSTLKDTFSISDKTLLSNDPYLSKLVSADIEKALSNGYDGWIDDNLAFVNPTGWGQIDIFTSSIPTLNTVYLIRFTETIFGISHQNFYVTALTGYGILYNVGEYVFPNLNSSFILNNVGPLSIALKLPSKLSELNNSDINNSNLSNILMDLITSSNK
jgi:pimeloyl-ACP methyl ester carboxylesterase